MTILVLDSDGLIKLTKSGIIEEFLKNHECKISEEVYKETVEQGKEGLYEDAYEIDKFVSKNLLKVKKHRKSKKASKILEDKDMLGEGEKSTLYLFFNLNADAIISDDQSFIKMENIKPYIKENNYLSAKKRLKK